MTKWRHKTNAFRNEYKVWYNMHRRCYDPQNQDYHNYGGKGIRVCDRWHDFDSFCDDMLPRPEGMTLGRLDHDKDYDKDNCTWHTPAVQSQNREFCNQIEWDGKRMPASMWAEELGMSYATVLRRYRKGYPPEIILYHDPLKSKSGTALLAKYGYDPLRKEATCLQVTSSASC